MSVPIKVYNSPYTYIAPSKQRTTKTPTLLKWMEGFGVKFSKWTESRPTASSEVQFLVTSSKQRPSWQLWYILKKTWLRFFFKICLSCQLARCLQEVTKH